MRCRRGCRSSPGRIRVTAGANAGTKTDTPGDDQGEYIAASRTVRMRLGTGANGTTGGTMAIDATATVVFRVKVDSTVTGVIENQAIITARGPAGAPRDRLRLRRQRRRSGRAAHADHRRRLLAEQRIARARRPYCLTTVVAARVRLLPDQHELHGDDADLRTGHAHLPRVRRRRRVPLDDARVPSAERGLRRSARPVTAPIAAARTRPATPPPPPAWPASTTPTAAGPRPTATSPAELRRLPHRQRLRRLTPVCDPVSLTCRGCGSDSECGGATPACQPTGRVRRQCSASNAAACTGATPVCNVPARTCVRCTANADCSGATPVCNGAHAHLPRLRGRRRMRRRHARLPADGRLRRLLGGEVRPRLRGRDTPGLRSTAHAATCARLRRRRRRLQRRRRPPADGTAPAWRLLARRDAVTPPRASGANAQCGGTTGGPARCRRLAPRDGECGGATPGLPADRRRAAVCSAGELHPCMGATPVCNSGRRNLRDLHGQRPVHGATPVCNVATNICRGCAGDGECGGATPACQPTGACGACSASNTVAVAGARPVCNTGQRHLRDLHHQRTVRRRPRRCATPATHTCRACAGDGDCGGATPACQAGRRLRAMLGQATRAACTGATPRVRRRRRHLRGLSRQRRLHRNQARLQRRHPYLPRLRRRRRVRRRRRRRASRPARAACARPANTTRLHGADGGLLQRQPAPAAAA